GVDNRSGTVAVSAKSSISLDFQKGSDPGLTLVEPRFDPGLTPFSRRVARAWSPWVFLSLAVIVWGLPQVKATLNRGALAPSLQGPRLHNTIFRAYPLPARKLGAPR